MVAWRERMARVLRPYEAQAVPPRWVREMRDALRVVVDVGSSSASGSSSDSDSDAGSDAGSVLVYTGTGSYESPYVLD